jgi:hypothetical protein
VTLAVTSFIALAVAFGATFAIAVFTTTVDVDFAVLALVTIGRGPAAGLLLDVGTSRARVRDVACDVQPA